MARSRRSASGRADWVYRGTKFWLGGNLLQDEEDAESGTYYAPFTLNHADPGEPSTGATAQVLYDSAAYMGGRYGSEFRVASAEYQAFAINPEARPEGARGGALIHGVDVNIHLFNSTWSENQRIFMGMRIITCLQDRTTGRALLEPAYSMWQDVLGLNGQPATWANGRQNCWEDRLTIVRRSGDGGEYAMMYKKRVRFKRRLEEDEGLFLYLELHPSSNDIGLINPFCRTLVTDNRA